MPDSLISIIRQQSKPLEPIPTEATPKPQSLSGIRAVMFDIYGTLLISGSGDVGTADETEHEAPFREALEAVGIQLSDAAHYSQLIHEEIQRSHEESRAGGIEYPEVEIREIWQRVLDRLMEAGVIRNVAATSDLIERLSLQYEVRTNPVWPMPGCGECLETLETYGLRLGIISNAQFYTPMLFDAFLKKGLYELGFDPGLSFYSFESRRAKPGLFLYERAAERLGEKGIVPGEVLYVGNDMLKDAYPASEVGFRTALFAGDARSLRLREGDPRTANLQPDLIVTNLADLPNCLTRDN